MSEHPIGQRISDELEQHGHWFETFEHEPVRTSEEAAKMRPGYTLEQGAKAIILRIKVNGEGKKFVMLVMPGNLRFDSAKVKKVLRSSDIRFATEDEVNAITDGVKPGGVPPFGNLFGLQVVCDPKVFDNEKMVFNAGRNFSIGMKTADYKTLVQPFQTDIC